MTHYVFSEAERAERAIVTFNIAYSNYQQYDKERTFALPSFYSVIKNMIASVIVLASLNLSLIGYCAIRLF
jgi:hypothetical protein